MKKLTLCIGIFSFILFTGSVRADQITPEAIEGTYKFSHEVQMPAYNLIKFSGQNGYHLTEVHPDGGNLDCPGSYTLSYNSDSDTTVFTGRVDCSGQAFHHQLELNRQQLDEIRSGKAVPIPVYSSLFGQSLEMTVEYLSTP